MPKFTRFRQQTDVRGKTQMLRGFGMGNNAIMSEHINEKARLQTLKIGMGMKMNKYNSETLRYALLSLDEKERKKYILRFEIALRAAQKKVIRKERYE